MAHDEPTPLVNRVSAPEIANIWAEGDNTCRGVATGPLDPNSLPDGCQIVEEAEISGGKRSFTITEDTRHK